MNKVKPLNLGLSLAGTGLVMYLLCALFVWAVPGGMESALTLVAHGVNLSPLFEKVPSFGVADVLAGAFVMAVYWFVAGSVFGGIYNRLVKA
jgi:hypothetical protein